MVELPFCMSSLLFLSRKLLCISYFKCLWALFLPTLCSLTSCESRRAKMNGELNQGNKLREFQVCDSVLSPPFSLLLLPSTDKTGSCTNPEEASPAMCSKCLTVLSWELMCWNI